MLSQEKHNDAVKGVKEVMEKLSLHDEDITATEALAEAVTAFNHKEIIRGFSPAQHLLGQAPDETGRFIATCKDVPPHLLCEHPDGEFERGVQRRSEAEKAVLDWNAQQRILRAKHSKHRPCYDYWCSIGGLRTPTKDAANQVGNMGDFWDQPESWLPRVGGNQTAA